MGGEHAVAAVVEEFVEALAADPGLAEDVGDGGRLVAAGGGDPDDRGEQPLALRAGDQLAREPVAPARQPPAGAGRSAVGHRARASSALPAQPRLAQRLVVAGEGAIAR